MVKDFIHKSLINAGSKDAVSNMLQGAALGAGANTALGVVQGDFDIVGNATAGALLGAGGGAAMRYGGDKYTAGLAALKKANPDNVPGTFQTSIFTAAEKDSLDFWGNNADNLKRAQSFVPTGGKPAAAAADAPEGGKISTGEASNAEKFRDKAGYITDGNNVYKSTGKTKDMQMPTFNTFDAFGRKTSQDGGTIPMDMHRSVSPAEQATTLRADEIRQEKKATSFADAAKNPVNMSSDVDSSYQPRKVSDIASKPSARKQAQEEKAAQNVAGDLIAGIFKETGRGAIKKPTSFEGGTLGLNRKTDSSDFKPTYRDGEYLHPQHNKVKKYQPE